MARRSRGRGNRQSRSQTTGGQGRHGQHGGGAHAGAPGARIISRVVGNGFPRSGATGANPRLPAPGGRRGAPHEHPRGINHARQNQHVPGTPEFRDRAARGQQGSAWNGDERYANQHTYDAWYRGTPNPRRADQRDYDFGYVVGHDQRGRPQTRVRVHMDAAGIIHGHPR
jgi:hypothetical protein